MPLPDLSWYIGDESHIIILPNGTPPWHWTSHIGSILRCAFPTLGPEFTFADDVAIHRSATVGAGAVIQSPAIVCCNASIAPQAYLRSGVFVGEGSRIGSCCEVKASFVFKGAVLAHLNYVGDSIIGAYANLEAGAVVSNHFNERADKEIDVVVDGSVINTGVEKFGALIGHHVRIGANAVTSPGTILAPHSIVPRLTLVDQRQQHATPSWVRQ